MKIMKIMTRNVEVVRPDDSLQEAAEKMRDRDIGFLPVCDGKRLLGTLSDRDIAVGAAADGMDPKTTPVRDVMHTKVFWCFDDQKVSDAAAMMKEKQVRRLMVIHREDKKLVGVVSLGDLAMNGTEQISNGVLRGVSAPVAG